ncbi:TetR/AcrR family transcriptional regulator [Paracoccus pacificus]|uniref:TetR/AcrR family transcriptional regulator n=1 Tax=Paracoccus pacificus TaxID=1463598 RepID=A0ABW4R599_9RHOB
MARTPGSRAETTASALRREALRLIARHGYAAVSMRQIAAAVGVQVGALYAYTPDKQSLLYDLLASHMQALLAAWAEADDPAATADDRLERFVRLHLRFNLARPEAVFLSYMELRNLTPDNFARIEAMRRSYEDGLTAILTQGQAEGSMRHGDVRLTGMAIIAMLTGANTWYREGGRLDRAQIEQEYLTLVRGAVGIPAGALAGQA